VIADQSTCITSLGRTVIGELSAPSPGDSTPPRFFLTAGDRPEAGRLRAAGQEIAVGEGCRGAQCFVFFALA
jgi:hypothetical protein